MFMTIALCADKFTLDNQTDYPAKDHHSKIAIQWANSADEVQANNNPASFDEMMASANLYTIDKTGKVTVKSPANAKYFRVVAWTTSDKTPNHITNWVEIKEDKTYTLDNDHLTSAALMSGMGC